MSIKGTLGQVVLSGQTHDVVFIRWQKSNPEDDWYVNSSTDDQPLVRCKLLKLLSRRPTDSNPNIYQDAWSYQVLSEKEFQKMAQGRIPIDTDTPQLGLF